MTSAFLWLAAIQVAVTCAVHSIAGERRLIGPLMRQREGVLAHDLARQVLRFAWHFTSAIGLVVIYVLVQAASGDSAIDPALILLIGLVLAGCGLIDAIYTRGKHIGWPLLIAAGGSALAALI